MVDHATRVLDHAAEGRPRGLVRPGALAWMNNEAVLFPIVALFIAFQRFFIEGVTVGSVKG